MLDAATALSGLTSSLSGGKKSSTNLGYVNTDDQGQTLLFRDNHIASSVYSLDANTLTSNPKNKFSYFVRFLKTNNAASSSTSKTTVNKKSSVNPLNLLGNVASTALDISGNQKIGAGVSLGTNIISSLLGNSKSHTSGTATQNWSEVLGFYAKTCDRPNVSFRTKTINQYNKKRVVQTGHDFSPISISFNDTADGAAESMFREYYDFYYGDIKNTSTSTCPADITSAT